MLRNLIFIAIVACFSITSIAQTYTTPNTGVTWTLADLAANSPSTVQISGSTYTLSENLIIAQNDAITITEELTLSIAADLLVTVFGELTVANGPVTINAVDTNAPYEGFRFEQGAVVNIANATITRGGGLRVLTENFTIDNCIITDNVEGAATGAVISLSRGIPQITNNTITFNDLPAISSGANIEVSPYIFNNYIEGNNRENSNRPQINMGITRPTDTLIIRQNIIIGDRNLDMVGGIAVANFLGGSGQVLAAIDDNTIVDNRYGMTILGNNSFAYVRGNTIENNDTQGNPNLGGSGISLNSASAPMEVIATGNAFRGNLWGITLIDQASINLGDGVDNPGNNVFSENGNTNEVYALYNNTPNTILAKNNCWIETDLPNTLEDAESVIFHFVDDPTLGEVIFDPVDCNTLGIADAREQSIVLAPNPAKNKVQFTNLGRFERLVMYNVAGQEILSTEIFEGENTLHFSVPAGMYFISFHGEGNQVIEKLVVQ